MGGAIRWVYSWLADALIVSFGVLGAHGGKSNVTKHSKFTEHKRAEAGVRPFSSSFVFVHTEL